MWTVYFIIILFKYVDCGLFFNKAMDVLFHPCLVIWYLYTVQMRTKSRNILKPTENHTLITITLAQLNLIKLFLSKHVCNNKTWQTK